jgi:O-methyltransferase
VLSRLVSVARDLLTGKRASESPQAPLDPPVETEYVDILFDPAFRRSVSQVKECTCLDVARLANLWTTVRLAGPGTFLEVGSYRGGTALHICNAMDDCGATGRFFSFDPFESGGFETLVDGDQAFKPMDFTDTRFDAVTRLLSGKPFATVVQGFFPSAAEGRQLGAIAFCHLDVDVYEGTRKSLEYLEPRLAPKGLIVLDDLDHKECPGVRKAMTEFLMAHPRFVAIPMFPCQAVLVPKSFWDS